MVSVGDQVRVQEAEANEGNTSIRLTNKDISCVTFSMQSCCRKIRANLKSCRATGIFLKLSKQMYGHLSLEAGFWPQFCSQSWPKGILVNSEHCLQMPLTTLSSYLRYCATKVVRPSKNINQDYSNRIFFLSIIADKSRNLVIHAKVVIVTWLAFVFFVDAVFQSNLRAYLISIDFEPEINNDYDIYKQKKVTAEQYWKCLSLIIIK